MKTGQDSYEVCLDLWPLIDSMVFNARKLFGVKLNNQAMETLELYIKGYGMRYASALLEEIVSYVTKIFSLNASSSIIENFHDRIREILIDNDAKANNEFIQKYKHITEALLLKTIYSSLGFSYKLMLLKGYKVDVSPDKRWFILYFEPNQPSGVTSSHSTRVF